MTEPSWVLVPRTPSEEMLKAGNKASLSTAVLLDDERFACERATYRAMIEAAPPPPEPGDADARQAAYRAWWENVGKHLPVHQVVQRAFDDAIFLAGYASRTREGK